MAHNSDVAEMTYDMTCHDSVGMFMLMLVSMSSYSSTEWRVFSWCMIASPPHGKVCGVFDGLSVRFMLHLHISPSLILGMLPVFIHSRTSLLASLLVHHVRHRTMSHPCTCMCNHSCRDDIKSKNILVYHDASSFIFGCKWPRKRRRLWNYAKHISGWDAGSKALSRKIAYKSLGGWGWEICDSIDLLCDLAQLGGRTSQFFQRGNEGSREDTSSENYTDSLGRLAVGCGSLLVKTA